MKLTISYVNNSGDTMALYGIHSEEALNEIEEKIFLQNRIHYEQNKNFLAIVRHEALFAAYVLTINQEKINKDKILFKINKITDLPEDIDLFNNNLYDTVYIKYSNKYTTYGNCLFNKWCGFDHLILEKAINKKESNNVSRWIYRNQNRNKINFYKQLNKLEKLLFSFISITSHCPSISITDMIQLVDEKTEMLFKKLPKNNIMLGYYLNEALVDRCIENYDHNSILFKLYTSGSRFNKTQLSRSCINIGFISNDKNIVVKKPINTNLLKGLTEDDFFAGSPATRKSISDKSFVVPQSGYLERTMVMSLSILEIVEEDCGTNNCIETVVSSKNHAKTLSDKYYKLPGSNMDWEVLDYQTAKKLINKKIYLRSPITCQTPNLRMCKKCFGEREFKTNYLGIVAGSNLVERLTQLILRTFHTSASAELTINKDIKNYFQNNLIDINHINNKYILKVLDLKKIPEEIQSIPGYENINIDQNEIIFNESSKTIENKDTVGLLQDIKLILKKSFNVDKHPQEYYNEFMRAMLTVGTIYSSFVEMLFANIFLVDEENRKFWRYYPDQSIQVKLGDKDIAKYISKLLGLLYEPNKRSIEKIEETFKDLEFDPKKHTIYEKLWLNQL